MNKKNGIIFALSILGISELRAQSTASNNPQALAAEKIMSALNNSGNLTYDENSDSLLIANKVWLELRHTNGQFITAEEYHSKIQKVISDQQMILDLKSRMSTDSFDQFSKGLTELHAMSFDRGV